MSKIKAIKAVMLLENYLSIFRKDLFNSKNIKYIIPSIWPAALLIVIFQDSKLNTSGACLEIQNFILNFRTIAIIFCSTYYSDEFLKLTSFIDNFDVLIERKNAYSKMTKRLNMVVICTVLLLSAIVCNNTILYWSASGAMTDNALKCNRKEVLIFLYSGLTFAGVLNFMESLLYYCLCSVIAYQLESLSDLIRTDMLSLQSNITGKFTLPNLYWRRWGDIYMNISECVELLNTVFGLQITLTLAITGLYFVFLFHIFIAFKSLQVLFMFFISQFMAIALITKAGQVIKNEALDLKRTLVRVKLKVVEEENEESFNAISSVMSLTSGRPIHTQTFGNIATGHAMLPAVFMYYTTPLIIVLQFKV